MGRLRFEEIAKAKYKENRNLVVSRTYDRNGELCGYAVSRQLVENEGQENETRVFLKDGIGVIDSDAIVMLADMFAYVCHEEDLITISDAEDTEE